NCGCAWRRRGTGTSIPSACARSPAIASTGWPWPPPPATANSTAWKRPFATDFWNCSTTTPPWRRAQRTATASWPGWGLPPCCWWPPEACFLPSAPPPRRRWRRPPRPARRRPPAPTRTTPRPPREPRTLFSIHGSNTVGEELAPALVKDYLASRGGTEIVTKTTDVALETRIEALLDGEPVAVEIHAHGSSTAFADLAAGATDIGMSSRKIKGEEVAKLAPTLGDLSLGDAEHIIALDGLAVVVNPGLAIREMNVATVAAIFAGEIANWQQLGGPDLPIQLFARDDNSG